MSVSRRSLSKAVAPTLGALLLLCPQVGAAETLMDAIDLAYQSNPSLRAQRAQLRATDEGYVQAKAGYGPQVSFNSQVGYDDASVNQGPGVFSTKDSIVHYHATTESADLQAVQPLYTAGSTAAQVRGAAADVLAARENLRQAESQLLQNVITAYVDVRRDRETVRILKDEIVQLTAEFNEIKAKGALGVVTKTDVAQSEERLLSAQAQLNLSYGHLNASNAEYLNYVGQSPGELEPEPDLPGLPGGVDDAFTAADHNNAQLLAAVETERAAREKVNLAKSANGPSLSVKLDASATPYTPYLEHQNDQSVAATLIFTQPIFTSGMNSSKVREALEADNQAQLDVETTRRGVVQLVAQAWDQLVSTRSAKTIEQQQLADELVAVEGNRIEERVGQRSTIDLLNAELELANTRIDLLQSGHDEYVAAAVLLSAMGLLEVRYLDPAAQTYDPAAKLNKVESLGSPSWEDAIGVLDSIGAPHSPAPSLSPTDAGAARPADMPPLPKPTP